MIIGFSRKFTAPPAWQTVFSHSLPNASAGFNGYNVRQVINSTLYSAITGTPSLCRVTLTATAASGGFQFDACEIGHQAAAGDPYDLDATLKAAVLFSGSAGATVAQNTSLVSDSITFAFDVTKNIVLAIHFNGTSTLAYAHPVSGAQEYYRLAASEVSVSNVSGYTTDSPNLTLISKIELQ